jgi:putative aldouronate transport system substrate-binding protein
MKRILALMLSLMLLTGAIGFAIAEEPAQIHLIMRNIGSATSDDNETNQAIEEATGVKVNITFKPGADYATTCQMVIASGELPDAMEWHCATFPNDLQELADDGLLMPVDDLLQEYGQNILAHRDADKFFRSSTDGKIYAIPCRTVEYACNNYVAIRQDWLDKLGLETPESSEQYYQVLTAFKENAAQLAGADAEFWPMGAHQDNLGISDSIFDLFASENGLVADWNDVDGEAVYYINMPGYYNTIKTIRKFYQDGLIDPEYALMSRDDMLEKWYNNAYGSWLFYLDNSDPVLGSWAKTYYSYYPEAKIGGVYAFPDENGVSRIDGGFEKQMFVIFKDAQNPEAVMKVMNYLCSDEGVDLVQLGIRDVDWTEDEAGNVVVNDITNERKEALGYKSYYLWMMQGYLTPSRCYDPSVIEIGEKTLSTAVSPIVLNATQTYLDSGTTLDDIRKNYATRLIVEKDIDFDVLFDEYVQKWNDAGGAKWSEEYNALYQEVKGG